jgi:hypothetical protein
MSQSATSFLRSPFHVPHQHTVTHPSMFDSPSDEFLGGSQGSQPRFLFCYCTFKREYFKISKYFRMRFK